MNFDDVGRTRTGTVWTATAHAVTAVIGSGVLAVPWSVAQMGWIFGPLSLFGFAVITYITARLLCDCYRTPDPVKGQRNHSYMDAIRATLGKNEVFICALAQYSLLWGTMVGYTITAATSILSVKRTNCYHTKGPEADCQPSSNSFLLIFGAVHIVLSQLPSLEKVFAQPIFASYEKWLAIRWPVSPFIHNTYTIQLPGFKALSYQFTLCRLLLRPLIVVITVLTAMMFPFFNAVLGLLGSIAFFPLTVYLPVRMYMTQVNLKKGALKWCMLQGLSLVALLVSLNPAVGSVTDVAERLKHTKFFSANL